MEDALLVGGMLITMLNHADRVRIGCLAQTVNALAPIRTSERGAWRQTIFWPFALTSKYGRGVVLQAAIEGQARELHPSLLLAAVLSEEARELRVFALNRHLREALDLEVNLSGLTFASGRSEEDSREVHLASSLGDRDTGNDCSPGVRWITLRHDDLKAVNTEEDPDRVKPSLVAGAVVNRCILSAKLAPASWNLLRMSLCD